MYRVTPIERVLRAFSFQRHDEPIRPRAEIAQHGVGELAVHLHVLFTGDRVSAAAVWGARVAENLAEQVGQEIGQDLLFLEGIGPAGRD